MRKVKIAVDIDGVWADFVTHLLDTTNKTTNMTIQEKDITAFNIFKIPEIPEIWRKTALEVMNSRGFCYGITPYKKSNRIEDLIQHPNIDVTFVTAPARDNPFWVKERTAWVYEQLSPKSIVALDDRIVFSSKKSEVEADFLIEDHVANILEYKSIHPRTLAALVRRPWNRSNTWNAGDSYKEEEYALQVRSLDHAVALILQASEFATSRADIMSYAGMLWLGG